MAQSDVIVIGGGHNGLVAATYLARAGLRVLLLERRPVLGGAAATEELGPGYRCPTLAHGDGPLAAEVARELGLIHHGLALTRPAVRLFAAEEDGPGLCIYQDPERTAAALADRSQRDAVAYREFYACFRRLGQALRPLLLLVPPHLDQPGAADLWGLLRFGQRFRGLGQRDAYRLLRYGPMAAADLVGEWFETELLRSAISARGVFGSAAGPQSGGTALPLLLQAALDEGHTTWPALAVPGGVGALVDVLHAAARAAGVKIRTGAAVAQVAVKDGAVTGVVLEGGEEIAARGVLSGADPRRTFLGLVDPMELDPGFLRRVQNYRLKGCVAKVNLALSGLPRFAGLPAGEDGEALRGRIHIGPRLEDLERAFDASKYGALSERPYLDLAIPSLSDPQLAPKGGHVLSIHVQYAPYQLREGTWAERRDELLRRVLKTLSAYAPNLSDLVVGHQVLTPEDLERTYGLSGGHPFHGEMSLEQLFTFRPFLGWARYRTPIKGLYLCGAGTHPGGGVTGLPGRNASRVALRDLRG